MGLRGHKWFVWEGGIRVTWMAQWKGHLTGGQVVEEPVIQLDVLPTALAAAGTAKPEIPIDGVNLLPLMEGKAKQLEARELYFRFGVQHAVRQGEWKLVKASKEMEPMLVNLKQDPGEQRDVSLEHPAKKAELQRLFDQWDAEMQPPRWEDQRWNGEEDRKDNKKSKRKAKAGV
jgi:arylsulfatase A-like enzyme